MKGYIGILHKEQEFVMAFVEYMNRTYYQEYLTVGFTKEKELIEFIKKEELDVLFVAEEWADTCSLGKTNVVLTNKRDGIKDENLFCFQNIQQYLSFLPEVTRQKKVELTKLDESQFAAAVYSPVGGVGKTQFALDLAKEKGGLYLGMEEFSDIAVDNKFPDLLYRIKQRMTGLAKEIEKSLIPYQGVDVLLCQDSVQDMRELTQEDLQFLIQEIMNGSEKKAIVFDIGVGTIGSYQLLDVFQRIYIPCINKEQGKIQAFQTMITRMGLEKVKDKFIFIETEELSDGEGGGEEHCSGIRA